MRIGITIGLQKENESMWINGVKLNAIFLLNVLLKLGYDAYLVDTSNKIKGSFKGKVQWDITEFPVFRYQDIHMKTDVLILLGTSFVEDQISDFKKYGKNKKVIKYMCGNNYVIDMERSMFKNEEDSITTYQHNIDEVWYVPQQAYQNHDYYRVLHKLPADKVKPVPFIWDPMFIDKACDEYGQIIDAVTENGDDINKNRLVAPVYIPKEDVSSRQLVIYEPNMNVVKYHMIPLLIVEEYYRSGGKFRKLNIISGDRLKDNHYYNSLFTTLDLYKGAIDGDIRLNFTGRYPVHNILSTMSDVIISHQWENPLNYAYLDAMYLQFPLIHNADMIQDAGYYYPDFNVERGTQQLKWVMENHDNHIDQYNANNENVLERYTCYNEDLMKTYKLLIEDLLHGENKSGLSYKYNWKTNTYL